MNEKNHGLITLKSREKKATPAIPRALQTISQNGAMRLGLDPEEAIRRYGKWKLRCLRPCGVYGTYLSVGDTFETNGADAVLLVGNGQAEFVDNKIAEEKRVMGEMKRLGLDKRPDVQAMPEFQVPEQRESWLRGKSE